VFDGGAVLEVTGAAAANRGDVERFLLPFDLAHPLPANPQPQVVTPASLRVHLRRTLSAATPRWTSLRAAASARMALMPFQIEPALALVQGMASRVLLADDVGLGKTVQAGLAIAEVHRREPRARILVVTPAGLREQWRDELAERFELTAEVIDAASLARTAATLPPDVNPWTVAPLAITSVDFVKRPEVIRGLEPLIWDLAVFDEAHALATHSDRGTAAALLCARARRLILVSATPHPGDDAAFDRLTALGALEGDRRPLVVFRRGRREVSVPDARRTRWLRVQPTPAEAVVYRDLAAYARRLRRETAPGAPGGAHLLVSVLTRRALSSPAVLARSIERRMALLSGDTSPSALQLALPLVSGDGPEDGEPISELALPGLASREEEVSLLRRMLAHAREAARTESKMAVLRRWLRRVREPVIVFTHYRDTLDHVVETVGLNLAPVLHGGLEADERRRQLRAFTDGDAPVLLATDAASEGLNLHWRCRVVLSLEVPWTPLCLEQRIGRVDRLGQRKRPHAVTLVARRTPEEGIAARLQARADHAGTSAPFQREPVAVNGRIEAFRQPAAPGLPTLVPAALTEVRRVHHCRGLAPSPPRRPSRPVEHRAPVAVLSRRPGRLRLYWLVRAFLDDAEGIPFWDTVLGSTTDLDMTTPPKRASEVAACLSRWRSIDIVGDEAVVAAHEALAAAVARDVGLWLDARVERERAIAAEVRRSVGRLAATFVQAGLFDRRAERGRAEQRRMAEAALASTDACLHRLERLRRASRGGRDIAAVVCTARNDRRSR